MFLEEDKIIFIEDRDIPYITNDPYTLLDSVIYQENKWQTIMENLIFLEHEAIITEDRNLMEDGRITWMSKAMEWFKTVFEHIHSFNIKVVNHIKEFKNKSASIEGSFLKQVDNNVAREVQVPRSLSDDLDIFEKSLNIRLTDGDDTLKNILNDMETIEDPRERLDKNTQPLNTNLYERCYNFVREGRTATAKKIEEFEKESKEIMQKANEELKKLENRPEDFDVKLIDVYRKRLRNLQVISTNLVRNMDYATILCFNTCVEVAKENIAQKQ